jgi:hypothetical protein
VLCAGGASRPGSRISCTLRPGGLPTTAAVACKASAGMRLVQKLRRRCWGLHWAAWLDSWRRNGSPWCMEPTAHDSQTRGCVAGAKDTRRARQGVLSGSGSDGGAPPSAPMRMPNKGVRV